MDLNCLRIKENFLIPSAVETKIENHLRYVLPKDYKFSQFIYPLAFITKSGTGNYELGVVYLNADIVVFNGLSSYKTNWLHDFEDECVDFPNGAHDDQVDPMSMYLKRTRERRQRRPTVVAPVVNLLTSRSHWRDN